MKRPALKVLVLAPEPDMDGHRGQGGRIRHLLNTAFDLIASEFAGEISVIADSNLGHQEANRRGWSVQWPAGYPLAIEQADVMVLIGGPADMRLPQYMLAHSKNKPAYQLYLPRRL